MQDIGLCIEVKMRLYKIPGYSYVINIDEILYMKAWGDVLAISFLTYGNDIQYVRLGCKTAKEAEDLLELLYKEIRFIQ